MWPWKDPFDTAENYDRGLGVDRDPSWRTRGLPDRPSVWPVGIYWDQPKTPLGKRLLALRNRAIAKGMKLLSEDEVLKDLLG